MVTDGYAWRHLAFYEKDKPATDKELDRISEIMMKAKSSFIVYSTSSGGYHVMGLTPLSTITWAYCFKDLDTALGGNCSGHVLRINKKYREEKNILESWFNYPCIEQLRDWMITTWKFDKTSKKTIIPQKMKCLFCLYGDRIQSEYLAYRPMAYKRIKRV